MNRLTFGIIVLGVSSACLAADDVRPQKYAYAVRAEAAPAVDGKLDDAADELLEKRDELESAQEQIDNARTQLDNSKASLSSATASAAACGCETR